MEKPRLSFWQIWNMSFGFLGIQFGWGLQMSNMSAIYEFLGAKPDEIPFLWLAAPLTGLIVQPIIGNISDHTWGKFGRRRPFFFIGALLASFCLILMPNSPTLWMAAGLLWILDTSINISMEPFRAFVADMLPNEQRTKGFAMQSFFIGLGAVIASALPYILTHFFNITGTADGSAIPTAVRISFYVGSFASFAAVLYTIITTKEYPPENMEEFMQAKKSSNSFLMSVTDIFSAIRNMPAVMRQLALVQVFSWLGLFFMWLYFPVAITKTVFANIAEGTVEYKEATQWGGVCFSFYSVVTFAFAFVLPILANKFSRKFTHLICLFCGGIGLISVYFITNKYMLFLSMTGVGIAWASILSMPYSILSTHLPKDKVGIYMGIFNFFIVLPEIITVLFFGWFMLNVLGNNKILAVMLGGCSLIVAGLLVLLLKDEEE